jgi:hypothetical protein
MLPLDDPHWDQLSCHNISGSEFADILLGYYGGEIPSGEDLYEDLLQCACGGDVYDSSYAAAPHLVKLAQTCHPDSAAAMLGFAISAIVEAPKEVEQVDDRITAALTPARLEGLRIAPTVFAAVSETHSDYDGQVGFLD